MITKEDAKRVHLQVREAVEAYYRGMVPTVSVLPRSSCSYDPTSGQITVRVTIGLGDPQENERLAFERWAHLLGLHASDYGREFDDRGTRYRLVEIAPHRRFPFLCVNLKNQKRYAFTLDALMAHGIGEK